jgi:glycogen operon protein
VLPPDEYAEKWDVLIDTGGAIADDEPHAAGARLKMETRSVVVLREHRAAEPEPDHSVAASLAAQASNKAERG